MSDRPVLVPYSAVRLRDRLLPVLTALMAGAYLAGAQWAADHVGSMNTARLLGALMAGSAAQSQPEIEPPTQFTTRLFPGPGSASVRRPDTSQAQQREHIKEVKVQIGTVEVLIHLWRRSMWGLAVGLGLCAMLAALTGRVRLFHFLAAVLILLGTAVTLVGIRFLVHPDWGAMPPLPVRLHILTPCVQSAYGWILLVMCARASTPAARSPSDSI